MRPVRDRGRVPDPHPGRRRQAADREDLSRAALWFPAVGPARRRGDGGTYLLADLALPPGPSVVLALLAAILMTGGFHEDGLADAADAAGATSPRAQARDPARLARRHLRALAVALPLLFPYSVLVGLDGEDVLRAAVAAHVLGRWSPLPQSLVLGQARPEGQGVLLRATPAICAVASAYTAAIVLLVAGPGPGAIAIGVAVLITALAGLGSRRVFGGVTGDTFGATNKLVELGTYAALVAAW
jgi:adenosylcobinamide-GDP ribazoletransferase